MLLECVPNFSAARDRHALDQIASAIQSVKEVSFLGMDVSFAANRTVMTFAGPPGPVLEAAFQAIQMAGEILDMRNHQGVHPRIGSTDVCPLIPLLGISLQETVGLARQLAKRVGEQLAIPVYLYAHSAKKKSRVRLSDIRKGGYESLRQRMAHQEGIPDFGPKEFQAKQGATVIGARQLMIAYNMNLEGGSLALAKKIASMIREKSRSSEFRFQGLRALGWHLEDQNLTQVSTNLMDLKGAPIHQVYETVAELASRAGARLAGSEIIGLTPKQPLLEAGVFYKKKWNLPTLDPVEAAIEGLGLHSIKPFKPCTHILENALHLGQNLSIPASIKEPFQT